MSVDVYTLLSLPQTSNGFAVASGATLADTGSASPPRKIARLDADSDSASASRSRPHGGAVDFRYPLSVHVVGPPVKTSAAIRSDSEFTLVTHTIRALLTRDGSNTFPSSHQRIFDACRSLVCFSGRGEGLFERLKIDLEKSVGSLAKELLEEPLENVSVSWLVPFVDACVWFGKQVDLLQSLLTYLDRLYLKENKDRTSIRSLSYALFRERVFNDVYIGQRLRSSIQQWIAWERENRAVHDLRPCIQKLIQLLIHHGQYEDHFRSIIISFTRDFYTMESNHYAKTLTDDATQFLKHCITRRNEEYQRAIEVLPEWTRDEIVHITDKALLTGRLDWLAKSAIPPLMKDRAADRLGKMYNLFAKVDGLHVLVTALKLYVQQTVKDIVTDAARDDDMVDRLLDLKAFLDKLIDSEFVEEMHMQEPMEIDVQTSPGASSSKAPVPPMKQASNREFEYAVIDAFSTGFKSRRNKPAEMIAKYIDRAMRKGQRGRRDEEFQAELDAVLGLYRFTDDKDVFRTFYHRALAKRLLLERSASDDFEKAMLKKLKEHYDPDFGMGDHMFNDLALSRDQMRDYTEQRAKLGQNPHDQKLNVMVLQRSFWPFAARKSDVDLPSSMQEELMNFTAYYKHKHQGHKLDWDHALGTATLKAKFKGGDKELSVSLYQAVILLLFDDSNQLSFTDIKDQSRIEDTELRRTLQSLACGKKRVLRKIPPGKEVHNSDMFRYNADFVDSRYQVHINSIQVKETVEENQRTQTAIEGDRKHALDAAIVRVMKARKELRHEQLITATIEAVKQHFVPDVKVIKQRLDQLVEQEYLRRDEDDFNKYIYVA